VVRTEWRQWDTRDHLEYLVVGEGYRYDLAPPPDTFAWQVPPGKQEEDLTSREVWRELPEGERRAIRKTIDRSNSAWVARDFARFAAVWDFDYLNRFPRVNGSGAQRRRAWKTRMGNQPRYARGKWRKWDSRVVTAVKQRQYALLGSLPISERAVLKVDTASRVTWPDGSSEETYPTYYLAKEGRAYRIIDWSHDLPRSLLFGYLPAARR
jgi:hypothetical protein